MKKDVERMYKEIGSNFWLDFNKKLEQKDIGLEFLNVEIVDISLLSRGRSAISYILNQVNDPVNKTAILPPFTCHTVIDPFINSGYKVIYYKIDKELKIDEKSLLEYAEEYNPSVILVHGYYGFNTLEHIRKTLSKLRSSGIVVIEDITHSIYSGYKHMDADYYMFSFRKWTALPDGGCAISAKKKFAFKPYIIDENLVEAKSKAFTAKYMYMEKNTGNKSDFLRLYNEAEQILTDEKSLFAMSTASKLYQSNLDINFLKEKRRRNFQTLLEGLKGKNIIYPVFKSLPHDVTPLYFPVYAECERDKIQKFLALDNIYAPVVWPMAKQCENKVSADVMWIYGHILAIPCDQRYGNEEMKYILDKIEEYQSEKNIEKRC